MTFFNGGPHANRASLGPDYALPGVADAINDLVAEGK
jgi:hypothetical protein